MYRPFTFAWTVRWLLLAVAAGVCVAPLAAQSDDVATVIELQGQVSVMRGGELPLFHSSTQTHTVRVGETIVTGPDGHAVFQIQDGSTFEVFPNSRAVFRDTYNFQEFVNLLLGKIRVVIEHRNGPNPKKVSTPTAVISVRGTVFDVSVEDAIGTTYVSVEEGQVQVQHRLQPGDSKILNRNDSVRVFPNQPLAKASGPSPGAVRFVFDRIRGAVADIILNNPGGVGLPGGGAPGGGTAGGQGDGGKTKKPAPTSAPSAGAPPAGAPPPPGGGI